MKEKSKKALLVSFIVGVLCVLFSFVVHAEEVIRVEGERPQSANFTIKTSSLANYSEQKALTLQENYTNGKVYKVSYKVNMPQAGVYTIEAASTVTTGVDFTSEYYIQVNDEEMQSTKKAPLIETITSTVKKYNLGMFSLKEGDNTISFIVKDTRSRDNQVVFFLDYFELKKAQWGIQELAPDMPMGIFEQDKAISYTLKTYFAAPENHTYQFRITDFWGAAVVEDTLVAAEGIKDIPFPIGLLKTGWYKLELLENNQLVVATTFAVVPPMAQRQNLESPFAVDLAAAWLLPKEMVRDYSKAAKMAGIQWVRDRTRWRSIEPKNGEYDFSTSDPTIDVISSEGLNMLNVFHDAPAWSTDSKGTLPVNLFDMYDYMKTMGDRYANKVQAWEIWNEADHGFGEEPADVYSAVMKAGAIGVSDSIANPLKIYGGFANHPGTVPYIDLALQNKLMEYSDAYNYHAHIAFSATKNVHDIPQANVAQHALASYAYDQQYKPIWLTEAGMYMPVPTNNPVPTKEELAAQARYIVTSTVESLASGVNKYFWFILSPYIEGGRDLGSFSSSHKPYPCYAAEAVMTDTLGKGKYIGEIKNLPQGAQGTLFDTGKGQTAVLWSENPVQIQLKADQSVTKTDIMGGTQVVSPDENGNINISISFDPIYINFGGECPPENYWKTKYKDRELEAKPFTESQRIVLVQKFDEKADMDSRLDGYKLYDNDPTTMSIDLYNFNNKPMRGIVKGLTEDGFTLEPSFKEVEVGAMSKVSVSFTLSANERAKPNVAHFLYFEGEFEGEKTTPTVSRIMQLKKVIIEPDGLLPGADKAENWDVRNITKGGSATVSEDSEQGSLTFKCNFTGGDRWFYPYYQVEDASVFENASGLIFSIYSEEDMDVTKTGGNVFAYFSDKRVYFLGASNIPFRKGWNQIQVPWEKFRLNSSPFGVSTDLRPFDPTLIEKISIGFNTKNDDAAPYSIKEVGYYTETEEMKVKPKEIKISGIEEGQVFTAGNIHLTAVLPQGIISEKTRVLVEDTEHEYTLHNADMEMNLSDLTPGSYKLTVVAYTPAGYAVRKQIKFYVN